MALVRVGVALVSAFLLLVAAAHGQAADGSAVAAAYAAARLRGDVEGLLPLFAPDAVVTDRFGGAHVGAQAIREILQLNTSRGQPVTIVDLHADGDRVSWVEQVSSRGTTVAFTAQAVVKSGRIRALVFGGGGVATAPVALAETRGWLPAPLGLGAVLAVLTGALVAVCASPVHRPPADSVRPPGWLLGSLQQWCDGLPR